MNRLVTVFLCIGLAIFESSSFAEDTQSPVFLTGQNLRVDKNDLDAELAVVPEQDKIELLTNYQRVKDILKNIATQRILASKLKADVLNSLPTQKRLLLVREKLLAKLYLESFEEEKLQEFLEKQVSFERRAKEIYRSRLKEKYTIPAKVHASHLLLKTDKYTEDEANKLLLRLKKELEADPSKFEELVLKYSDDPTVTSNKGDLGFFPYKSMVEPFAKKAFAMQPGEISDPVKTKFGWHLIKVQEIQKEEQIPFETVKFELMEELKGAYLTQAKNDLLKIVWENAQIQYLEDQMKNALPSDPLKNIREEDLKKIPPALLD